MHVASSIELGINCVCLKSGFVDGKMYALFCDLSAY